MPFSLAIWQRSMSSFYIQIIINPQKSPWFPPFLLKKMSPCIQIRSNGNTSRISDPLHHMSFLTNITKADWVTSSFPLREAGTSASRRRSGFAKTSWSTAALYCYPDDLNFHAFPQTMQPGAYMRFLFGTVWRGCRSVLMIDVCIYADVVQNIVLWTQL